MAALPHSSAHPPQSANDRLNPLRGERTLPSSYTLHPSTEPSLIVNALSMPEGRLIAKECACESPTITMRAGPAGCTGATVAAVARCDGRRRHGRRRRHDGRSGGDRGRRRRRPHPPPTSAPWSDRSPHPRHRRPDRTGRPPSRTARATTTATAPTTPAAMRAHRPIGVTRALEPSTQRTLADRRLDVDVRELGHDDRQRHRRDEPRPRADVRAADHRDRPTPQVDAVRAFAESRRAPVMRRTTAPPTPPDARRPQPPRATASTPPPTASGRATDR